MEKRSRKKEKEGREDIKKRESRREVEREERRMEGKSVGSYKKANPERKRARGERKIGGVWDKRSRLEGATEPEQKRHP